MSIALHLDIHTLQLVKADAECYNLNTVLIDHLLEQFPPLDLSNISFSRDEITSAFEEPNLELVLTLMGEKMQNIFFSYPGKQTIFVNDIDLILLSQYQFRNFHHTILNAFDQIPPVRLPACMKHAQYLPQNAQMLLTRLFQEKVFQCPICAKWVDKKYMQRCANEHIWCKDCLKKWLFTDQGKKIDELLKQDFDFKCFYYDCPCILPHKALVQTEIPKIVDLYKNLTLRKKLIDEAGNRGVVCCPTKNCVGVAYELPSHNYRTMLTCKVCDHKFQRGHLPHHKRLATLMFLGLSICSFAILDSYLLICNFCLFLIILHYRLYGNISIRLQKCKRCPKCNTIIQKNWSDHVKCQCGHEFTWSKLKPHTSRFGF